MGQQIHNLFFAAVPPPAIKARMAEAWRAFGTGEDFRHDTLHLSVHGVVSTVGLDPGLVQHAKQAPNFLRTAPFTLSFDRLARYGGGPRDFPLVLATERPNQNLNAAATELHAACHALNITASRLKKPSPHVTLAYGPGFAPPRVLAQPILWTVTEIILIDSLQGQGRHVHLGTWPLPLGRQQQGFDF